MQIEGFDTFLLKHSDIKDFTELISSFKNELLESKSLNSNYELILNIAQEKYGEFITKSWLGINYFNTCAKVNDSDVLNNFINDWTNNVQSYGCDFKKAEKQHYKTIKEIIAFQKIDIPKDFIERYKNHSHPFICSKIAIPFLNRKLYDVGLFFLKKSLFHVFSYPNIYWDNPQAIYGCTDALFELQHLLGRSGMNELTNVFTGRTIEILKILYLYLSRSIYIMDFQMNYALNNFKTSELVPFYIIEKINYLSIRADLIYDYKNEFLYIFGAGVNPDIQYIADKSTVYNLCEQFGLGIIGEQCRKDALKMYQHGSLTPNYSGGYVEIEDATLSELIKRGNIRSLVLSNRLMKEFNMGKFAISKAKISSVICFLKDKLTKSKSIT